MNCISLQQPTHLSLYCSPQRLHFCGPSMDLSLRPLIDTIRYHRKKAILMQMPNLILSAKLSGKKLAKWILENKSRIMGKSTWCFKCLTLDQTKLCHLNILLFVADSFKFVHIENRDMVASNLTLKTEKDCKIEVWN